MVKVVNISSRTVEVAGVDIKPHTVHMFSTMSTSDRLKVSALVAVNVLRAYEGDYDIRLNNAETTITVENTNRKSKKK